MPIVTDSSQPVNPPPSALLFEVALRTGPRPTLAEFSQTAVDVFRRRHQPLPDVLERPFEAARLALISHLLHVNATTGVVDEAEATRITMAVLQAYLTEPVVGARERR